MNDFQPASNRQSNNARLLSGTNAALGQGFTSVTGTSHNSAVTVKSSSTDDTKTSSHLAITLSLQELAHAVSTEQSAGIGFLDLFGFQEKTEFAKSLHLTTFSLCLVVHARKASKTYCTEATLTEEAVESLEREGPSAAYFVTKYGDTYIKSVERGGEYIGVLHFACSSREAQQTLKTKLEASGILRGLKLEAEIKNAITSATTDVSCSLTVDSFISGISNPPTPITPYEIIHYADTFTTTQLDSPTTIAIDLAGYEEISPKGSKHLFEAIRRNREKIFGSTGSQSHGLIEQRRHLFDAKCEIDRLQDTYRFYHALSSCADPALEEIKQLNRNDLDAFEQFIQGYIDDPCKELDTINSPSLNKGVPTLAYTQTIKPLGQWDPAKPEGGDFKDFRDITEVGAFLLRKTTIKSIQIQSCEWVDGLTTRYSFYEGENIREITRSNGGEGGSPGPDLIFNLTNECSDYVTEIRANIDSEHLAQLMIKNKHEYIVGGENRHEAPAFSITFSEGGQLIPFAFVGRASRLAPESGKARGEVRQIGMICVTLQPVTWEHPFPPDGRQESPTG